MSETAVETPVEAPVQEAPAPAEEKPADLEAILPSEFRVVIDGMPCKVRRLKTREFLALVQVLTSGLGPALGNVKLDFSDDEAIARDLSALMLLAIPNAVDEFVFFLTSVVEPVKDSDRGKIATYLQDNPDIDVMLEIFEGIAVQEKDDLVVLAGKAQAMWSRVAGLYTKQKP